MEEHHIQVRRTARYFTLGTLNDGLTDLWLVCHGYGQHAGRFLNRFAGLERGDRLIVSAEGLSRFYVEGSGGSNPPGKVGASWMTREDRLIEIDDYVAYLDAVTARLFERIDRGKVRFTALGFSQGVATVARWAARADHKPDRLILWAGLLPPDLELDQAAAPFANVELRIVVGAQDQFVSPAAVAEQETALRQHGIRHLVVRFDGGHVLNPDVLTELAKP